MTIRASALVLAPPIPVPSKEACAPAKDQEGCRHCRGSCALPWEHESEGVARQREIPHQCRRLPPPWLTDGPLSTKQRRPQPNWDSLGEVEGGLFRAWTGWSWCRPRAQQAPIPREGGAPPADLLGRATRPAMELSAEAGEGHAQAAGTVQAQPFRSVR